MFASLLYRQLLEGCFLLSSSLFLFPICSRTACVMCTALPDAGCRRSGDTRPLCKVLRQHPADRLRDSRRRTGIDHVSYAGNPTDQNLGSCAAHGCRSCSCQASPAALSDSSKPYTRPRAIVMVSWMGVMTAVSLHGSCASPAPIAAAEALAA